MLSKEGFDALGPVFAMNGWVFFGPYRRGQGLSASVGKYIGDEIAAATKTGGLASGRSEEHTSELHHRCISYAVFCLKKKKKKTKKETKQRKDRKQVRNRRENE